MLKRLVRPVLFMLLVSCLILPLVSQEASASGHPILYLFWGQGCPHCEKEREFLQELRLQFPQLEVRTFDTWSHPEFDVLADALRSAYGVQRTGVPLTFIGEWTVTGFRDADTTGAEMIKQVEACLQDGCIDALEKAGPLRIVLKIRDEAAQNAPLGWELYLPGLAPQ